MQYRLDGYLALLDKYSKWEATATNKGELLEKTELGMVDGVKLKFSFIVVTPLIII
jgi:hypothetical protein